MQGSGLVPNAPVVTVAATSSILEAKRGWIIQYALHKGMEIVYGGEGLQRR